MAITVRRLVEHQDLGLSIVAGRESADRVVTWAHAIELADPTPYLSGGELVMSTGMNVGATAAGAGATQKSRLGRRPVSRVIPFEDIYCTVQVLRVAQAAQGYLLVGSSEPLSATERLLVPTQFH